MKLPELKLPTLPGLKNPSQVSGKPGKKTPLSKKKIPTLMGLLILVGSLVAGLLMFSDGTGVFAPRATPATTPKSVKVTNVTDKSFTVSFYTDEATSGFVRFGPEGNMRSQASDDRDQLSGSVGSYQLHHITVRGLTPSTTYSYVLGTGSKSRFDNNGTPFTIQTFPAVSGAPPINKTIYGTVATEAGAPAEGSIVYVTSPGMGEMSSLVKSSGSWAIALSNARATSGAGYAQLEDGSELNIIVQGVQPGKSSIFSTTVAEAQPTPEVTLGTTPSPRPVNELAEEESLLIDESADQATNGAEAERDLADILDTEQAVEAETVLDLEKVSEIEQPAVVAQPIIKGVAKPGVTITIQVNSETQVTQTLVADETGAFSLDFAALGQQLEPGEHTVTYSYSDPDTGRLVTRTQSFYVPDTSSQIAQASTSSSFGSGNPVPVTTPTPTPVPTATPTATPDTSRSAVVSTESGTYNAGSVENTIALVIGGVFFIFAGAWSWWLAHEATDRIS